MFFFHLEVRLYHMRMHRTVFNRTVFVWRANLGVGASTSSPGASAPASDCTSFTRPHQPYDRLGSGCFSQTLQHSHHTLHFFISALSVYDYIWCRLPFRLWVLQCWRRKLVAILMSLFEALRASRASVLEKPISTNRATCGTEMWPLDLQVNTQE